MKIGIIIITYNAKYRLKKCLESIQKFTRESSYTITIVDNASTDGTACFLKNYREAHENINILSNKENLGFSKGANLALRNTHHRFICLLDDDIEVTKNWLSDLLGQIKNKPKVGIVGCKIIGPNGKIWSADYRVKPFQLVGQGEIDNGQKDYIKECDALVGPCWLMRRKLVKEVGWFDERFFPSQHEDIDYCLRTRLRGYRIIYNGKVKIIHHHLFREEGRFVKNQQLFFRKWKGTLNEFPLKDSHPADIHIAQGFEFLIQKEFKHSVVEFKKAQLLDQRFSVPFYMGLAYKGMRRYDEAILEFKETLKLNPQKVRSRYYLASLYKKIGLFKKARIESGKALNVLCGIKSEMMNGKMEI